MKPRKFTIFRRIGILVFILITGLCILFMGITYLATTTYHEASTQLLNKDVASHIAEFTSPFEGTTINQEKADSVFYNAMVISPSAEVYFLDTTGKVLAFHVTGNEIRVWNIPLGPIGNLINSKGTKYIKNVDPRDPGSDKIFSAAEVRSGKKLIGYIYVIIGSNKAASQLLYTSYVSNLLIRAFCFVILLSLILSFFYLNRIQRSFNQMVAVLTRFESGDLDARFSVKERDELAPVTNTFNNLADLLVYNINRLKATEQERKDFIASISHDLRTPLSIARGYAETVVIGTGKDDEAERQRFSGLILQKISQVEYMVKQLFDLSKMDAVDFVPHKEPLNISEILMENLSAYKNIYAERKLEVVCDNCDVSVWVMADTGMMERLVQNLLLNAFKYTLEGGSIDVSFEVTNQEITLEIGNSGPPVSDEIVEWFNLSDGGIFSKPADTGFGLLIVKKIAMMHQFKLKLIQASGGGNLFVLKMPVFEPDQLPKV